MKTATVYRLTARDVANFGARAWVMHFTNESDAQIEAYCLTLANGDAQTCRGGVRVEIVNA
jgi:hypothetical protein